MSTGRTIVPKCRYFGETGVKPGPEKFPFAVVPARENLENGLQADPWGKLVPGRSPEKEKYNRHSSQVQSYKKSCAVQGMICGEESGYHQFCSITPA
jgi:hypothetical protein